MQIALTGATGFLGRYLAKRFVASGHRCRCWYRGGSDRNGFEAEQHRLEWIPGNLEDTDAYTKLVDNCDAVVHAALYRVGDDFRGGEGDLVTFLETNFIGTVRLIETARSLGVPRFVFVSTCAVHEQILEDRPLDEIHPATPKTHYGAHKSALEQFVHSYGWGLGYEICALRPTGIYGLARPPRQSKWFPLIEKIVRDEKVDCHRGGKEVHAADVARAAEILLAADGIAGEVYNCCDRYISEYDVASLAKRLSGSDSEIGGNPKQPRHTIETGKLQSLGMKFGGEALLEQTVAEIIKEA